MELDALERIEMEAYEDLWRAAPRALAQEHGIVATYAGGALCLATRALPGAREFNHASGLGVTTEATADDLDAVEAFYRELGIRYYVAVAPFARPARLVDWLAERGYVADYGWAKFRRGARNPPPFRSNLRIDLIGPELASTFGRVATEAYGLPAFAADWIVGLTERAGWSLYLAWDGDEPAATGALYTSGRTGWLGFGATLPEHRSKGAQSAILSARIARAADLGCELLVTETGEDVDGRPSTSFRNILRSGFEVAYVRPNHRSPASA